MTIRDIIYLVMWLVCSAKSKSHVINTQNDFHVQFQTYVSETWNGQFFIFNHYFLVLTLYSTVFVIFFQILREFQNHSFLLAQIKKYYSEAATKVFCKKAVYKNFAIFAGKHLCWRLLFNKVAGLRLKKRDSLC